MPRVILFLSLLIIGVFCYADDGYRLWLRYDKIDDAACLHQYIRQINSVYFQNSSPTLDAARKELLSGLKGLLGKQVKEVKQIQSNTIFVYANSEKNEDFITIRNAGPEGFRIETTQINSKYLIR